MKATAANEITAIFDATVPSDSTFALTKDGNDVTGTAAVTDATVVFTTSSKMQAGTYTFTATLGEQSVSQDVVVEEQKVTEIKVYDEEALTAKSATWTTGNDDLAYVYYDVLDQYGSSMKTSETINWTTSPNYIANDTAIGRLTIKQDTGFTYGSSIFVTGVHVKTGTSVSTSVTVGASQAVDTIEFTGFLNKNDKTKIETNLPSDFAAKTYVLLYKAFDQNGHALDMNDTTIAENITFINDNPTLIDSTMAKDTTLYTVDGEEYAAIEIEPGIYVDKGGEVNITAISNKTGKKSTKNYVIGAGAVLYSFAISSPSGIITDGEGADIPFTATAEDGTAITNYESIVRSTNSLSLNASAGTLKLSEKADGTAALHWTDSVSFADYSATGSGMSNTYDSQERSIALTTIVIGGVSNNLMLSVSDMRYPAGIKDVTYDTTVVDKAKGAAKIATDGSSTITFTDQYGDVIGEYAVNKFFEYTASNTFNNKNYGVKAVSNDTKLISEKTVIVSGAGFSIPWTATLSDDAKGAETSNVKYTIVSKEGTADWADACQAKSVTSTIVPISLVNNLTLSTSGTLNIATAYSEYKNGATIGAADQETAVNATTTNTKAADYSYSVAGKYNGVEVAVPADYYEIATGSAINADGYVNADGGLKLSDLYDFTTYNNPRQTAKVTVKVQVNNGAETAPVLSAKLAVSDAPSELVNLSINVDDTVTPSLGKLDLFKVPSSLSAMNQWYGAWCANAEWLAENNYAASYINTIGGLSFTVDITNINESTSALTHLSNSFTVSGNGTVAPVIEGAEVGDTFTITLTLENGASISKNVTVGPDAYANISSDGSNNDKTLREYLGYNR